MKRLLITILLASVVFVGCVNHLEGKGFAGVNVSGEEVCGIFGSWNSCEQKKENNNLQDQIDQLKELL